MGEREKNLVEQAYDDAVKTHFQDLVTKQLSNDESDIPRAIARFERGMMMLRRALELALQSKSVKD